MHLKIDSSENHNSSGQKPCGSFMVVVVFLLSCSDSCDSMDRSLSGSFVHGISQARILKWAAISFFRWLHTRDFIHSVLKSLNAFC